MTNNPFLLLQGVTKKYKKETIVESFSFHGNKGEVVALLGKNGAGKSTIIKMLAGMIEPSNGEIILEGLKRKKNKMAYARKIAYMPDHYNFNQPLTVIEFLKHYTTVRQASLKNLDNTLKRIGLEEKAKERISSLSKGMGQRLLLGLLLLSDAELLLLDEPTNGLDKEWVQSFQQIIIDLKQEEKLIIFSTHDHDIAKQISDRVVHIN